MKKTTLLIATASVVFLFSTSANACSKACEEAKRDKLYSEPLSESSLQSILANALAKKNADTALGEPYTIYPIETSPDGENVFHSTLIEYPYGSSPRSITPGVNPRGIILYVHGYNDYYFQEELAEKCDSAGFAFFAIDLHYNGRSYSDGERRSDMRSIKEFYAELDAAVAISKNLTDESLPYVLIGHSQGGLIVPNYMNERDSGSFAALVLNSPFLDFNDNWFTRNVIYPIVSDIALLLPDVVVPAQEAPDYNISLLASEKGEWEFNRDWKSDEWPVQYFGYFRAVHRGIKWIHSGLDIQSPILVMRSGCTVDETDWNEDYMRCDCMLDVNLIEKWAPKLGDNVTTTTITDGMHDLFLSKKIVRDNAYKTMFNFLDSIIPSVSPVLAFANP